MSEVRKDPSMGVVQPLEWSRIPKDEYDDPETYSSSSPAYRQFYVNLNDGEWTYNGKAFCSRAEAQAAAQCEFNRIISSIFTPSIKALEWIESWGGYNDDIPGWQAQTPFGRISVSLAGHRSADGSRYDAHKEVPESLLADLIAKSTAHYEKQVRSALGASEGVSND